MDIYRGRDEETEIEWELNEPVKLYLDKEMVAKNIEKEKECLKEAEQMKINHLEKQKRAQKLKEEWKKQWEEYRSNFFNRIFEGAKCNDYSLWEYYEKTYSEKRDLDTNFPHLIVHLWMEDYYLSPVTKNRCYFESDSLKDREKTLRNKVDEILKGL